jgi:hypothetical protein
VKEVSSVVDGEVVIEAVKIYRKALANFSKDEGGRLQEQVAHEIEIWKLMHDPNIMVLSAVMRLISQPSASCQ